MDCKKNIPPTSLNSTDDSCDDSNILGRTKKKKFQTTEQWSQEENCGPGIDQIGGLPYTINGHLSPYQDECTHVPSSNKQCFNQNNNLVIDKRNTSDEKSCCYYLKFPVKVNNNIYAEKTSSLQGEKDGMEDYFLQHSSSDASSSQEKPQNNFIGCDSKNILEKKNVLHDQFFANNNSKDEESFPDHINALNGEEEDEDNGCIYTYKGDNYEDNLSHLLDTCFSCGLPTSSDRLGTTQHGAVSIQRMWNGSPHPNPNPQSNLYSPDMDFLEMDFDPGSAGDGGDSDCEDNSVLNIDDKLLEENSSENFTTQIEMKSDKKSNNIPYEIKSLMCRRCEMCLYNEQKVNNTTNNLTQKLNCDSIKNDESIPEVNSSESNHNLNVVVSDNSCVSSCNLNLSPESESLKIDNKHPNEENNLNFEDKISGDEFSDGDEADDEGGDDSTSEIHPNCANSDNRRVSASSLFFPSCSDLPNVVNISSSNDPVDESLTSPKVNKQLRFSYSKESYSKLTNGEMYPDITSTHNDSLLSNHSSREDENCCNDSEQISPENNNLGSISAPEVSPSKEFSPLEKFSRSVSFHNQLSSPKYENVCFSHPYKDNLSINKYQTPGGNTSEFCGCNHSGNSYCKNSSETSNLEACVDRLNQRERSVFNIMNSEHVKTASGCLNNTAIYSSSACNSQETHNFSHHADIILNSSEADDSENHMKLPLTLPIKLFRPKIDNSTKDPNTVTEAEMASDDNGDIHKSSSMEKVMIWTERQATFRQVSQVGTSACGATAVINVLLALDQSRPVKTVTTAIKTRLRAENSSLVPYLLSRSIAGTAHDDLLHGVESISEGAVTGRFFHMFPKRTFQLSRWLIHWIKKGGVPVATLNLQVAVSPGQTIPDSWHHQMVFGVGPQGIYLTNPLECVSDSLLSDQLCSDSVLLVRRTDVESRWDQKDRLIDLSLQEDPRWNDMNVLGQVVCVLKEQESPEMLQGRRHLTSHIAIPASYKSGITIFMRSDNPCKNSLFEAPHLPFLDE